jgi:hypothetical protein
MDMLYSSDLFGFGVTLYEILENGSYPFKEVKPKSSRAIPYNPAYVAEITNAAAPKWVHNLFEIAAVDTTHEPYQGLFTAEGLYTAVTTRDYRRLNATTRFT